MTNRRELLQIGIAATALPLATRAAGAARLGLGESTLDLPLYKALYDVRFPESVAFARRIERYGIRAQAFEGDMTRWWYDELYHVWRNRPAAIAGLTAHGPLFCLERLAWDHGMRVVFRAEHRFAAARIDHEIAGPAAMLQRAAQLDSDRPWAACIADAVAHCPSGRAEIVHARGSSARPDTVAGDPLYSWVIAPVAKADS
jgi:hypothetical protein